MISICAIQRQGPSAVRLMTKYSSLARISETCKMFGQLNRVTRLHVDLHTHGFEVIFSAWEAADQFIDQYSKNCSLSQETISVETTNEIQPPQQGPPIVSNQLVTGTANQPIKMKFLKRGDDHAKWWYWYRGTLISGKSRNIWWTDMEESSMQTWFVNHEPTGPRG